MQKRYVSVNIRVLINTKKRMTVSVKLRSEMDVKFQAEQMALSCQSDFTPTQNLRMNSCQVITAKP